MEISSDNSATSFLRRVFSLKFFEMLSLVYPHPTVFPAPAVIGLFCNSCLPAGFCCGGSLTDENFDLPQLVDDLLRCKSLPDHLYPLSNPWTNIIPGLVFGGAGQSKAMDNNFGTMEMGFKPISPSIEIIL